MLVNSDDILYMAKSRLFGIGQFYATDPAMAEKILLTAQSCNMPVVIACDPAKLDGCSLEEVTAAIKDIADSVYIPVVMHFEERVPSDDIFKALDLGYTSVMADYSGLSYEENVEKTRAMAKEARMAGANLEAQIGIVPEASDTDFENIIKFYTDLEEAKRFSKESDADLISISVGNAYGKYPFTPLLDINLIVSLHENIKTPLSLHGTSGLHPFDVLHAVGNGVSKICCYTDIIEGNPVDDPGKSDLPFPDIDRTDADPVSIAIADRIILYQNR